MALSGQDALIERGPRVRVLDPDAAGDLIGQAYLPIRVQPRPGRDEFLMDLAEMRMHRMTAGVLSFASGARIVSTPAEQVHLNLTLRGRSVWRGNRSEPVATEPGGGVVFNPGQSADTIWSDNCDHLCVMVSRESLEAEIEAMTGHSVRSSLRFAPSLMLDGRLSRLLQPAIQLLVAELHHPQSALRFPTIGRHLEGLMLDGLLLGHEHTHSALLARPARGAATPVSRAVELLEERPEHAWSTVALAREVHLSVRALQDGFRRQHNLAPMAYLRRVRLRRAHHALGAAMPGSVRVQDVAVQFGFLHLGRFSQIYHQEFGEKPSATLARLPEHAV